MRILKSFAVISLMVLVVDSAASQDLASLDFTSEESVARGEDLMLELSRQRQMLPRRWACLIQYRVETTPDSEEYARIKGTSYIAEDRDIGIKVRRRKEAANNGTPGDFYQDFFDWQSKSESIYRDDDTWVRTPPGKIRPHFDPFMLCTATSTILDDGVTEDRVEVVFLGLRSCLGSRIVKEGTESVWGLPRPRKERGGAFFVLHDRKTGMPVEFRSRLYETWNPSKLEGKSKLITSVSTKWEESKSHEINLPVEVNASWTNAEALEASFELKWMFEKDVPDSAFVDPRTEKLVIPVFPGQRIQKKKGN